MKNYITIAASVVAIAAVGSNARAADIVDVAPAASWTAFHVGIGGGGGYNTYDGNANFDVDWGGCCGVPEHMDISSDNSDLYAFGTVEAGFDYQFGGTPLVIGVLGSFDLNGDSDSNSKSNSYYGPFSYETRNVSASLDNSWFVGGRLGYAFTDSSLVYGLVGYTWADAQVKSLLGFDYDGTDDFGQTKKDETVQGWTVGGGFEQMLTDSFSLKLEYRHDFLSSVKWDGPAYDPEWGGVDYDNTTHGSVDFGRDTVRAVLSYRLGM